MYRIWIEVANLKIRLKISSPLLPLIMVFSAAAGMPAENELVAERF
jgi:hypothetical protein